MSNNFLDSIHWNEAGLVPTITQEAASGQVLMMAWMSRESLALTIERGEVIYWSRSRKRLWRKGESSGNTQKLLDMRLDCDADVLLLQVLQRGGIACHTGRHHCFFRRHVDGEWVVDEAVLRGPSAICARRGDLARE